jgi:hypothetical protein
MHAIYEEKQGGFSDLDRTIFEADVIGLTLIQFRRHLPSIIRHGLQSYGQSYIKGTYQDRGEQDVAGNLIFQFQPKQVEGKFITLLGMMMYFLSASGQLFGKNNLVADRLATVFPTGLDSYAPSKLDQAQLENLLDLGTSLLVWGVMNALFYLGLGTHDDDNKGKKLAAQIVRETLQQWNMLAVYRDIVQTPASYKTLLQIMNGTVTLSISAMLFGFDQIPNIDDEKMKELNQFFLDSDKYVDKEEYLKGLNELKSNIPVLYNTYNSYKVFKDFKDPNGEDEE